MGIDVNNLFGLKAVPASTQAELTARTSNTVGQWHAARKPWAHIMSLAKNCAYDAATQFGVGFGPGSGKGYIDNYERPQPVLDSIDVKKQGELGTTRRVTIKAKAFTDDQLNQIAKCYFIPGMSVRVQFGWNMDAQGHKTPSPATAPRTDPEANALVSAYQASYSSYDGLQGVVTSYNASLDDNIWNITIEVIGAGTSFGSAKLGNTDGCVCEVKPEPGADGKEKEEKVKTTLSNIKAALLVLIDDAANKSSIVYKGKSQNIYAYKYKGYPRDEYGREDTGGNWYKLWLDDGIAEQTATYISLGALQRIVSCCVQKVKQGTEVEPANYEYNSDGVIITKPTVTLCADPRVAYIPGGLIGLAPDGAAAPSAVTSKGIILDNILVNAIHVLKIVNDEEKGSDSVPKFFERLLQDINYNCGGQWEFDFVNTSDAEPHLTSKQAPVRTTIVDSKKTEVPGKNSAYLLKANSKNSCIRSVKMDMKLTDSMKTQALYSGKLANSNSEPCNGRFGAFTKISGDNLANPPAEDASKKPCNKTPCSEENKEPTFAEKIVKLYEGVTDDTVTAVRGDMVLQSGTDKQKNCKGSIIPIDFGVVLDGIGGFSFGQTINCDRFPGEFGDYVSYQVTTVEHSITSDDWTTTISTVGRLR